MRLHHLLLVTAPLAVAACTSTFPFTGRATLPPEPAAAGAPSLARGCHVYDMGEMSDSGAKDGSHDHSGRTIDLAELVARCKDADVVFLGETHTDETTHRFQHYMLMSLALARGGDVALAMEQFERDAQKPLDRYLAGEIDEPTFRTQVARLWPNYDVDYRPMIELAKQEHFPVVASNATATVRRKLAMEGRKAFDALSEEEHGYVAREMLPHTDAYWKRVEAATSSHAAMGMSSPTTPEELLFNGQSVWDNTMAESIALALDRWPDRQVVHVNGGFHSQYFDGTVAQLRKRKPNATIVTIALDPVDDLALADPPSDPQLASYVVHVANVAQSESDDYYSVRVARDVRYRLHRPKGVAKPPLLVWLPGASMAVDEVESALRARFGDEAAIAVIEPTMMGETEDLGSGGRFFGDSFHDDVALGSGGTRRATEYLLRRLDLDATHVVVAGDGDGARIAIANLLDSESPATAALAFDPGVPGRIAELDPPHGAPGTKRSLRVHCDPSEVEAWNVEVKRQTDAGLDSKVAVPGVATGVAPDPWTRSLERTNAVREALGLAPKSAPTIRRHIVLDADTPRARAWGERYASKAAPDAQVAIFNRAEASARGEDLANSTVLDATIRCEAFEKPHALPQAPGPFGGTTVVVLPAGIESAERDAWLALEAADPIQKASRFHRLRVATADGDTTLKAVLEKLKAEGRKNVLVVPAVFCADGTMMRDLRASIADVASAFTIAWSPGLGGRLDAPKPASATTTPPATP